MLCILESIAAWLILMLIGTNLIGFLVRGLLWNLPPLDGTIEEADAVLQPLRARLYFANSTLNVVFAVAILAYLVMLMYFWNLGLAIAGACIMASRVPDLLWEIRNGRKVTSRDNRTIASTVANGVSWASLVLVWYSLCEWVPSK